MLRRGATGNEKETNEKNEREGVPTPNANVCTLIPKLANAIIDVPVLVLIQLNDACQASVYIILTVICLKKFFKTNTLDTNKEAVMKFAFCFYLLLLFSIP